MSGRKLHNVGMKNKCNYHYLDSGSGKEADGHVGPHHSSIKLARLDPTRGAVDVPMVSGANTLPRLRLCLEGGCASPERPPVVDEARAPLGVTCKLSPF